MNILCIGSGPAVFFDKISFLQDQGCNVHYVYNIKTSELSGVDASSIHPNTSYQKWMGQELNWVECVHLTKTQKILFHISKLFKPPYQYSTFILWPFRKIITIFLLSLYYTSLHAASLLFSVYYARQIRRITITHDIDVLLVRMEDLPYAILANKPIIYLPTGTRQVRQSLNSNLFKPLFYSWFTNYCLLNKVDKVLINYEPCYWFSYGSGLGFQRVVPWAVMLNRKEFFLNYMPSGNLPDQDLDDNFQIDLDDYDLVFFMPGRKDMKYRNFPQKVLKAYKDFYPSANKKILLLSLIRGEDAKEFEYQTTLMPNFKVSCLNVKGSLKRHQLWQLFERENLVVFDQFPDIAYSVIGGVLSEAMLNGAPIVSNLAIEGDLFKVSYPVDCPLYKARTSDEILAAMKNLDGMSKRELKSLRKRTAIWGTAAAEQQMTILFDEIKSTISSKDSQSKTIET